MSSAFIVWINVIIGHIFIMHNTQHGFDNYNLHVRFFHSSLFRKRLNVYTVKQRSFGPFKILFIKFSSFMFTGDTNHSICWNSYITSATINLCWKCCTNFVVCILLFVFFLFLVVGVACPLSIIKDSSLHTLGSHTVAPRYSTHLL